MTKKELAALDVTIAEYETKLKEIKIRKGELEQEENTLQIEFYRLLNLRKINQPLTPALKKCLGVMRTGYNLHSHGRIRSSDYYSLCPDGQDPSKLGTDEISISAPIFYGLLERQLIGDCKRLSPWETVWYLTEHGKSVEL